MPVTQVSVPVETRAPSGRTCAYVLGSGPAVLVDPAAESEALDEAVDEHGVGHVAVTHHHPDHVGAVAEYADRCDATVWARVGRTADFAAVTGVDPDRTFAEGTAIPTGVGATRVVDTPGHAPEHVAFVHRRAGADDAPGGVDDSLVIACGDLVVAEGSVAVAAPEGDMRAYLTSLRRIRAMEPDRLVPGHGPAVSGDDVRATVDRLVAHRLDREDRVGAAVAEGAGTVSDVCDRAYDEDVSGVRDLAEATVRAHLEKLAVEGRVAWDGERARPSR